MAHHWARLCLLCLVLLGAWGRPLKDPPQLLPSTVVQLTADTFDSHLRGVPADQRVMLEFYAGWCPACRRFQPTYDQVAAFFHTKATATPPRVVVAKVDCAVQVALCGEFKLVAYPSIYLGPASTFLSHSVANATQFPNSWKRKAKDIVAWAAKELSAEWVYEEVKGAEPVALQGDSQEVSVTHRVEMADVERATVELMGQATMTLQGATHRAALLDLMRLLAAAHPSSRCQSGAGEVVAKYSELWPEGKDAPTEELLQWAICGKEAQQGLQWATCSDSGTGSRGFTCGVWLLLHSLAARYPEPEGEANGGRTVMAGVNAFARNFFRCEQCARHFSAMLDAEDAKAVVSKRDAMLWLWRTHNKVNARLAKLAVERPELAEGPKKVQWPPLELCPSCRDAAAGGGDVDVSWVEDEIHTFLLRFFGSSGWSVRQTAPAPVPKPDAAQGPATSVSQFVLSTLLFTAALLGVWYLASASLKKHRPTYRRAWA